MIEFLHPEFLLLLAPLTLLLWRFRSGHPATFVLRALGGLALVAALAGPTLKTNTGGRDVVIVVDRSRSMPEGSDEVALELIGHVEDAAGPEDHVHVLAFGAASHVERAGTSDARFEAFQREVDRDGSDLAGALDDALELLGRRQGSILLLSDGEAQGRDPLDIARRAAHRGTRIDVREVVRADVADVSVERIGLPGEVAAGEPFQFDVWVRSDRRVEREIVLEREGHELARVTRMLAPGLQRLTFRDLLREGGVTEYSVQLGVPAAASSGVNSARNAAADFDRVPENDRARAALAVSGPRPILILNEDGAADTFTEVLRSAGFLVRIHTPEDARLDLVSLTRYRAVVLENVSATRVSRRGMLALAAYVEDHGGSLLMTGGQAAFGAGGYHRSPLDEVLPVSTELRQEHRKLSIAMAIAMDRSGSMAVPVPGGGTKMDLANAGAAAAIELLTPNDSVAVIAVDSAAHVVQPLTTLDDRAAILARVRTIQSMGGGIFTYTALRAAAKQLQDAPQLNRHIVLFADANDSEEQEGCFALIDKLRSVETTLSVIALGTKTDSDAKFLEECAKRGGGQVYFSTDPAELPRLFAMDTLTMSRSTFVDAPTATKALAGLFGMGAFDASSFPGVDGYNLCYLRPTATAGAITIDEYAAPVLAFWQRGLGRSAALTAQIGGKHGAALVAWPRFGEFAVTLVRWLTGSEPPQEYFGSTRREGREAVISVEVDPAAGAPPDATQLIARFGSRDGETRAIPLTRVDRHLYEARLPLDREGVLVGTVDLGGGRSLALAPQTLAYSPEFERGPDPGRGARTLRRIAAAGGGTVGPSTQSLFEGPQRARLWRIVTRELALCGLILLLLEIAGRRLSLWSSVRWPRALSTLAAWVRVGAWRGTAVERERAKTEGRPVQHAEEAKQSGGGSPSAVPAASSAGDEARAAHSTTRGDAAAARAASSTKPSAPNVAGDLGSALARARRASRDKLDR